MATDNRNASEPTSTSETKPLPENFASSACATKIEQTDPANVATVAQLRAVRYVVVLTLPPRNVSLAV